MRLLKRILTLFALLTLALIVIVTVFINFAPTFGGVPDEQSRLKIEQSDHYNNDVFVNLEPTSVSTPSDDSPPLLEALLGMLSPAADKNPNDPLPSKKLIASTLVDDTFVWLGHSTVLFKTAGKTFITDPVFHSAAPVQFLAQPFPMQHVIGIDDLPTLDAVLISHDHYDHLDYEAIKILEGKAEHFYVPLGIKAHLQRWGVAGNKITELDWYEQTKSGEVQIVLAPSRHFSGRGLFNRFSTLWGSWIVTSPSINVYFSGDTGYMQEFKSIGEKYGPFDIAFMEDGAYDRDWAQIHMMPEEAVQGAIDLKAAVVFPVHWGKFDLARHDWREPIERITQAAYGQGVNVATPRIGQVFSLDKIPTEDWWSAVR